MPDREGFERPQLYCRNCGAQARQGNAFCTSCGEQLNVEGGTYPIVRGSGSRNRNLLDQRNTKVALYGAGVLLILVVAYLLLSYSVLLGFLLIGVSVLTVLVIRKTRGTQTRLEQQVFEKAGQYRESAQKAYEEDKHREFAQKAYRQSREVYEEANTRYRRWSESQAAERERGARRRRFERYVSFFEQAHDGSQSSLDWWQAYRDEESDNGHPSVSDLLRHALERAETGLAKIRSLEEPYMTH